MKLVKDCNYGRVGFLGELVKEPSIEWLSIQKVEPLDTTIWYEMYPLSGGAALVQEGRFEILRDAVDEEINKFLNSDKFNPAVGKVRELLEM